MKKQVVFWSGLLGVLLFVLASILGGLQIEGYSEISQYISESYASGMPNTAYIRLMFVLGGLFLFIFGVLMPALLPKSIMLKIGFALFATFYGLGTITVTVFPCDFGCPMYVENSSFSQLIHNLTAFLTYVISPLAIISIGLALKWFPELVHLSRISMITGILALIFVFLLFNDAKGPHIGLFQRIIETSLLFWVVYMVLNSRDSSNSLELS